MTKILIIGNPEPTHVGRHFFNAAKSLNWQVEILDSQHAFQAPLWIKRFYWHLLGHRPRQLRSFSAQVMARAKVFRPDFILTSGLAPLHQSTLLELKNAKIPTVNFLTDDPWNQAHRAPWFMGGLSHYHHVFTPRRANLEDLLRHGVRETSFLPFAYATEEHFPHAEAPSMDSPYAKIVAFIGGADPDRLHLIRQLVRSGCPVGLWGGYWKEFPDLAPFAHGHATSEQCRQIVSEAGANLCVVRKANRDGHSMRSYELPAMAGLLLTEATQDHLQMYRANGEDLAYFFSTDEDLVRMSVVALSATTEQRMFLKKKIRTHIIAGHNSYSDRLSEIQATIPSTLPLLKSTQV